MSELALKITIAYLVGAIMGALILGRLRGVDIRLMGSGNAGGTNALRTQGFGFALVVVLVDVSKGYWAAAWLPGLSLPGLAVDPTLSRWDLTFACATAATVGHVYPIWWEFRGGKGAATLIGVLLGAAPTHLPPLLAVWLVTVVATGYVGLGTMLAAIGYPLSLILTNQGSEAERVFALVMATFVTYAHRSNIARMRAGHENRAQRLWYKTVLRRNGRSS